MKRWVGILLLISVACALPSLIPDRESDPQMPATRPPLISPTRNEARTKLTPVPTFTPTPSPSTPTLSPKDPRLSRNEVLILPQPLFAGDRLTVDVDPIIPAFQLDYYTVTLDLPDGRLLTHPVVPMGLNGEPQARFYWLAPFERERATAVLTVTLQVSHDVNDPIPQNNHVVITQSVRPSSALSPPEPEARWIYTETQGYRLHYLSGSAADRDLDDLMGEAATAYRDVTARLGEPDELIDVYIMGRVVGQGGYASSTWVAFSYVDRQYVPIRLNSVLRHELTHRLDHKVACHHAMSFLREGLAVYVAGGHYEPEPLRQRAAVLLTSEHYIPLARLVNDFYTHQHEVGYWEAGAFVQYLVETYGWDAITELCESSAQSASSDSESEFQVFAASVASLGGGSFVEIERAWESWLADAEVTHLALQLLDGKLRLMERMRAYQLKFDTAAHFTEGVLFSPAEAERLGIVADFVRHPQEPEAIAIELLLAMGYESFRQNDLGVLNLCIDSIDFLMAAETRIDLSDSNADLAVDVLEIVRRALDMGYEPYRLLIEAEGYYRVLVLDLEAWPQRYEMTAVMDSGKWTLQ